MLSYGKQNISEDDIQAVVEVLRSDWLTQGPAVKAFEDGLCDFTRAPFACAVSNGTAALHLIAMALGWKEMDTIITTPITFAASGNCARYVGAEVDFVDIDERFYTLDPNKLEDKLKDYHQRNRRVKAVVAVDYAGHPCDWEALRELANNYEFQLVNDNCHAIGAMYNGDIGYATKFADAVAQSYHPVKHITTGEGGAILTANDYIDERVRTLRTHGITKDAEKMEQNDGPWYYEMQALGFNYRITDFQCALGTKQLEKLSDFVKRRNEIADLYDEGLSGIGHIFVPNVADFAYHAYHLYPLRIDFDALSISKEEFFDKMRIAEIALQVHYIPLHLQPYYRKRYDFGEGDFPIAEKFYKQELSIPMYPRLSDNDVAYVIETIKTIVSHGKK